MINLFNKLNGWKTYITAAVAILTAILAWLNHNIDGVTCIGAIFAALQTMNIRHSITTSATAVTTAVTKTIPVLILFLLLSGSAFAQVAPLNIGDIVNKIPNLKQGVAYDFNSRNVEYFTTAEVANYKGFSLSGGYATSDKIVASLDYDLGGLEKLGINLPLLSMIDLRVGAYVGIGNLSSASSNGNGRNKFAYGPEVTVVSLKF